MSLIAPSSPAPAAGEDAAEHGANSQMIATDGKTGAGNEGIATAPREGAGVAFAMAAERAGSMMESDPLHVAGDGAIDTDGRNLRNLAINSTLVEGGAREEAGGRDVALEDEAASGAEADGRGGSGVAEPNDKMIVSTLMMFANAVASSAPSATFPPPAASWSTAAASSAAAFEASSLPASAEAAEQAASSDPRLPSQSPHTPSSGSSSSSNASRRGSREYSASRVASDYSDSIQPGERAKGGGDGAKFRSGQFSDSITAASPTVNPLARAVKRIAARIPGS